MTESLTPRERAEKACEWLWPGADSDEKLINAVTTAIQAQSNADEMRHREKQAALRTLLDEQAKRADEAEAEAKARLDQLLTQTEINNRAIQEWKRHSDALAAHAAELRRALLDARNTLDHDRTGIIAPWINRTIDAIDAALALTHGDALKRERREAGARALDSAAQHLMADFDKSRPVLPSEIAQDLLAGAAELRKGEK